MTKYHVEVDINAVDEDGVCVKLGLNPGDAVITEIKPQYAAGWYQDIDNSNEEVVFWSQQEVDDYGENWRGKTFDQEYRRMKDPEPWDAPSRGSIITEEEFNTLPNGSVITDKDGDEWFRRDDEWNHSSYTWRLYFNDYKPYTLDKVGSE